MEYTQAFFAGGQSYQQQFIGIPPLTPSHSNSASSDDYNTTSPPDGFPEFSNEHFQNFDGYAAHFATQPGVFPGPPTPPDQQQLSSTVIHTGHPPSQQQPRLSRHPPPATRAPVAATAIPLATTPAISLEPHYPADVQSFTKTEPGAEDIASQQGQQQEQSRRAGSNSDEDELTPAQSRRKAQNRAAQRAFRERKERHVKDLEAKLASLEAAQQQTATENERLRQDLQKVSTENEILRATSSLQAAAITAGNSPSSDHAAPRSAPMTTGPMTYNPTDFYTDLLANHENKLPSHRIATTDAGERLLAAGATWELIISHSLFKRGLVDVADISNRLKNQAKCDGQGPVFEERAILSAIEQSVGSGSDSLI